MLGDRKQWKDKFCKQCRHLSSQYSLKQGCEELVYVQLQITVDYVLKWVGKRITCIARSTNHSCWEHFVELSLAADIWARHASKTTNGVLSTWLFSCLLCFLSNHSIPKNIELALYWKWSSRMYGMIVRPHRYVGTPTQTHNIQSGPLLWFASCRFSRSPIPDILCGGSMEQHDKIEAF